jgi:hypothetical protein
VADLARPPVGVEVGDDRAVAHEGDDVGLAGAHVVAQRLLAPLPRVAQAGEVDLAARQRPDVGPVGHRRGGQVHLGLDEVDRPREDHRLRDQQVPDHLRPERRVHHHLGPPGGEVGHAGHADERLLVAATDLRAGDLRGDRLGDLLLGHRRRGGRARRDGERRHRGQECREASHVICNGPARANLR